LGDVIDKFGDLMPRYFSNDPIKDNQGNIIGYKCKYDSPAPEMHPLRWMVTRQIGCVLWCFGEMVGDWYPLLRTRAVAKKQKSMWLVYISCGLFNLSKIALISVHFSLSPTQLYDKQGVYRKKRVNKFYFTYWLIQLLIIYASMIYDCTVYFVLRKNLSGIVKNSSGFIKKFKTVSEYRILVSAFVGITFLPLVSFTIIAKYYYYYKYQYDDLNFSFDEIRKSINNVQYYMIFIDQILLLHSKDQTINSKTSPFPGSNNPYFVKKSKSDLSLSTNPKKQYKNFNNSMVSNSFHNNNNNNNNNNNINYNYLKGDYKGNIINNEYNMNNSRFNSLKSNHSNNENRFNTPKFGTMNSQSSYNNKKFINYDY